jgi:uncharacterized membrane protein
VPNGRLVPPGNGVEWITAAWRLFWARPGKWVLTTLLIILIYVLASWIPFANLTASFIWPFVGAGIVLAADEQRRTGTFDLGTLFGGFRKQPQSLLGIGAVLFVSQIILFACLAIVVGSDVAKQIVLNSHTDIDPARSLHFLLAILIYLALVLPITAATYLAPPLVVLNDLPAASAMKMSFVGSFKNVLSGLVFGLCLFLLIMASMIPLGLGLIVSLPLAVATTYTVYRDIFIDTRPS